MPFKWNAFRIQLIHQDVSKQKQGQQSHQQQQHPPQAQIRSNQSNGGGMGGGPTRWQRGDRGNMGERKQFQRRSPQRAEMQG